MLTNTIVKKCSTPLTTAPRRHDGIDNMLADSQVNPAAYKALYAIHVFDVMEFSENAHANTQAFTLVIIDRMLKFKSDGSKMSVLF